MKSVSCFSDLFQVLREIPIYEVARRYLPGEIQRKGSRWMARCPFHDDRNPSFVVFADRWKCFGCQARGDAVDLVARLYGLRPIEAARLIAGDFGIPLPGDSPQERAKAQQRAILIRFERELKERVARRELQAYIQLAALYRRICDRLAGIQTEEDLERLGDLFHVREQMEHLLDVLLNGEPDERAAAVAEARRWLRC